MFGQNWDSLTHHNSADIATEHPIYISWKSILFALDKHNIMEFKRKKNQLRQGYNKKDYSEVEVKNKGRELREGL